MWHRSTRNGVAALSLGTWLIAALPAAALPNPLGDVALMKRLRSGEIVSRVTEQGPVREVLVMGYIHHPAPTAFRVFTDYPRRTAIYPSTVKAEVRNGDRRNPHVYYLMDFPWPLSDRWILDDERLDVDNERLSWRMLEGNVKSYGGEAQFFADGRAHCVMVLQAQADPGIAFIPDGVMTQVQRLLVPAIVRSLRRYMDAGKHVR